MGVQTVETNVAIDPAQCSEPGSVHDWSHLEKQGRVVPWQRAVECAQEMGALWPNSRRNAETTIGVTIRPPVLSSVLQARYAMGVPEARKLWRKQ